MLEFRTYLRDHLMALVTATVPEAKLVDEYLHDVDRTQLPYFVVTVRQLEPDRDGEGPIGQPLESQDVWQVHIYYLDMDADRNIGDIRHGKLVGKLFKKLKSDPWLDQGRYTDSDGIEEYVYKSKVTNILFDSSGVEGDYSFVSEIYLDVYTDRNRG